MKAKFIKFFINNSVSYPSAFIQGYNFAYGDESYAFGEYPTKTELKHVPKRIKNKKKWIEDWHYGCAVGCEY